MATVTFDEKKLIPMLKKIYKIERENTKTENRSQKDMKEAIQAIIEEEAKKCY